MPQKKILICGGSGFIGKNLSIRLSKNKKFKIFATYHLHRPKLNIKNIKWIKCDLRILEECLKITKNKDIIIQCAATTSGSKDIINTPYVHVTDNAVMNSYLLKSCYINKIKHFIFTSCTVMYRNSRVKLNEEQVIESKIFKTYFGVAHTKLYIEKMCKFFSSISNIKFSIIRHSNIYGSFDKFDEKKGHFIGSSIKKIFDKKNENIKINGSGNEKRDFLFIDDFLNLIQVIIFKQKKNYEIINCSYGRSFSIKKILKKLIRFSKKNKQIYLERRKKNINVNILIDSTKAKIKFGWTPKVNINEGLKATIKWYRENNVKFL
jgi:nucleoside-diphosphate-sugar epimerase